MIWHKIKAFSPKPYTILFVFYPVIFMYSKNIRRISAGTFFYNCLVCFFLLLAVYNLLKLLFKNKIFINLLLSFFWGAFFSYGYLTFALRNCHIKFASISIGNHKIAFSLIILSLVTFTCLISKKILNLEKVQRFFMWFLCFLLLPNCINISLYHLNAKNIKKTPEVVSLQEDGREYPNIYYFILDGYGRQDFLQTSYGFDNSDFIQYLEEKGFFVFHRSITNYPYSIFSIASTLNMDYIHNIAERDNLDVSKIDWNYMREKIKSNEVFRDLKSRGYEIINYESGFFGTDISEVANHTFKGFFSVFSNMFLNELINMTPIPYVIAKFGINWYYYFHGKNILFSCSHFLENFEDFNKPSFVFMHLLCPHRPFIFNEGGLKKNIYEKRPKAEGYIDNIRFINRKFKEIIRDILNIEKGRAIIIIQSDHGPGALMLDGNDVSRLERYDAEVIGKAQNLSAVYFPDGSYDLLYPAMSNVNTFRVIFNECFHKNMCILEDKYYFVSFDPVDKYYDVTDKVTKEMK